MKVLLGARAIHIELVSSAMKTGIDIARNLLANEWRALCLGSVLHEKLLLIVSIAPRRRKVIQMIDTLRQLTQITLIYCYSSAPIDGPRSRFVVRSSFNRYFMCNTRHAAQSDPLSTLE